MEQPLKWDFVPFLTKGQNNGQWARLEMSYHFCNPEGEESERKLKSQLVIMAWGDRTMLTSAWQQQQYLNLAAFFFSPSLINSPAFQLENHLFPTFYI